MDLGGGLDGAVMMAIDVYIFFQANSIYYLCLYLYLYLHVVFLL